MFFAFPEASDLIKKREEEGKIEVRYRRNLVALPWHAALRLVGIPQANNVRRKTEATGTWDIPVIGPVQGVARMGGAVAASILWPGETALKQSAVADIPFFGGAARLAAFAVDNTMNAFGVIPVVGHISRAVYHIATAIAGEALPASKNYPTRVSRRKAA